MKQIIAMHGWCSDSNSWKLWEDHFKDKNWTWQNGESGYGKMQPHDPEWKGKDQKNRSAKKVLMCHSLGTHLISNKVLTNATDIVLLNSFSRFIPANKESRALRVGLIGMRKHLEESTGATMLMSFLKKASSPHKVNDMPSGPIQIGLSSDGLEKLKSDLELLINTNKLPIGISKGTRVLVINGDQDKIILSSAKKELLASLKNHLNTPPANWTITGEGHFILQPELMENVRKWLEVDT